MDDSVFKRLKREGGRGIHRDRSGRPVKYVDLLPDGRVAVYRYPIEPRTERKKTAEMKEHSEFLEDLMEKEANNKHPRVKPSEAKHAEKRLHDYVEDGRPLLGVDV